IHHWTLSDTGAFAGGCPGTFADSVGANPLTTPSPNPQSLTCGAPPISSCCSGGVTWINEATTDYLVLPVVMPSTSPAPSHWTVEMQMKPQPDALNSTHFFSAPWVLM